MAYKKLKSGLTVIRDKETGEETGVLWIFDSENKDGSQQTSYISKKDMGDSFTVIAEEIKKEHEVEDNEAENRKYSLDHITYEGKEHGVCDHYFDEKEEAEKAEEEKRRESDRRVKVFLDSLPPKQRKYLEIKMENPDYSNREIARQCGVDHKAVDKAFKAIKLKFANFAI